MNREQYFEHVQDAIEGLRGVLARASDFRNAYTEALYFLEIELEDELLRMEYAKEDGGKANAQAD